MVQYLKDSLNFRCALHADGEAVAERDLPVGRDHGQAGWRNHQADLCRRPGDGVRAHCQENLLSGWRGSEPLII